MKSICLTIYWVDGLTYLLIKQLRECDKQLVYLTNHQVNGAKSRFTQQIIERIRQTFLLKKSSSEREKKPANLTNHHVSRLVKVLYQYSFNPTTNMHYNLCNIGYVICLIAYWLLFYLWFESLHYLTRLHYQKKTRYNFFHLYNNPSVSKVLIFIYLVNYSLVNLTYKIK